MRTLRPNVLSNVSVTSPDVVTFAPHALNTFTTGGGERGALMVAVDFSTTQIRESADRRTRALPGTTRYWSPSPRFQRTTAFAAKRKGGGSGPPRVARDGKSGEVVAASGKQRAKISALAFRLNELSVPFRILPAVWDFRCRIFGSVVFVTFAPTRRSLQLLNSHGVAARASSEHKRTSARVIKSRYTLLPFYSPHFTGRSIKRDRRTDLSREKDVDILFLHRRRPANLFRPDLS